MLQAKALGPVVQAEESWRNRHALRSETVCLTASDVVVEPPVGERLTDVSPRDESAIVEEELVASRPMMGFWTIPAPRHRRAMVAIGCQLLERRTRPMHDEDHRFGYRQAGLPGPRDWMPRAHSSRPLSGCDALRCRPFSRSFRRALVRVELPYGEPIRDAGHREHEGAGRPPIDVGLRARARYMAAPCDLPGCAVSADQ